MTTKNRIIASLMSNSTSKVKEIYLDSDSTINSASLSSTASSGTTTYASIDSLPVSSNNGDQALVTSTNRLYIYSGSGWYNIALINTTPYWNTEANSSYELNKDGTSTIITILAVDSEGLPITYTATADSDFNQIATITKDSDDGRVFVITPTDSENGTAIAGTGTVTFKASDGVNLATTLSTFNIQFKIENSNYTTFLLKADTTGTDNQIDASTNAHTITEVGNVTSTAFTPYHPGKYSWYWAGDGGDYFTITSPTSALSFGTGDFCVEMWIYPFDVSSSILLDMRPASTNGAYIGAFGFNSGNVSLGFNGQSGSQLGFITSGAPVTTNKWHHIVLNRESGTSNIFVNGVREYTTTTEYNFLVGRFSLFVNAYPGGGVSDGSGGYLRDYRVVKGSSVYGTGTTLTVPTEPLTAITGTSLLLFQEPYISDAVGTESVSYVGGETKRFSPFIHEEYTKADHGGSVYFDGTGDYVTFPTSSNLNLGNGDFTIDLWVYMTAYESTGFNTFIMPSESAGPDWQLDYKNGSSELRWLPYHSATPDTTTLNVSGVTMKLNVWYHIAVVRSGNFLSMYLNGKHLKTAAYNNTVDHNSSTTFYVGAREQGSVFDRRFTGYMTDLRIVKSSALYDSDIVVPTSPLTNVGGTGVLTLTNKNDIWDASSHDQAMTKSGNVTASNTQRKFTTSSAIYFDGSGDYLDFVKKDNYHFGSTDDFTVEGWWYFAAANSGTIPFILMGTGVDATPAHYSDWIMYRNGSGNFAFGQYSNTSYIFRSFGSFSPVINTWYHIAVSRSGTDLRGFIDGVQQGSTITDSTAWTNKSGSRPLRMGRFIGSGGQSSYFNGYAQDVRITKGLARYTSAFTPPTTEFKG